MKKACETCVHKDKSSFSATCVECGIAMMNYEHMPFTNADHIRSMTDEELAWWITDELIEPGYFDDEHTYKLWLDWLREEVKDGKQSEPSP